MASSTGTPTRIHLLGEGRIGEGTAGGAITPGHLIMRNSSDQLVVHDNVQHWAQKMFALEDSLQGNGISTAYSSSNKVRFVNALPGDQIYAWLAGGEHAVIGAFGCSNGDGCLQVADDSDISQQRLVVFLEEVDQSESDDVDARVKVEVI